MKTESPVTPASELTDVRASSRSKGGERQSGRGADVAFKDLVARRTSPSAISGAGGRSFGMRGCVGALGDE